MLDFYFKCIKELKNDYIKLRKVLQIIKKTFLNNNNVDLKKKKNFIITFSLKFNNLKKQIYYHVFLFKLNKKIILIVIKKQFLIII